MKRHIARIPDLVQLIRVIGQVVGVHELGHGAHGVQNLAAIVIVDGQFGRPIGKEFGAGAQIHVHEFGRQIPARLVGCGQWIFHQALVLDDLRIGQNVFIGCRNGQAGLFQNVLAVEQVLAVAHEGNRHHLAVNLDQLVWLQRRAILRHQIIQRADQAVVQQRHDGVVGDHSNSVFRRIGGQRWALNVLVFGRGVGGHRHSVGRACRQRQC